MPIRCCLVSRTRPHQKSNTLCHSTMSCKRKDGTHKTRCRSPPHKARCFVDGCTATLRAARRTPQGAVRLVQVMSLCLAGETPTYDVLSSRHCRNARVYVAMTTTPPRPPLLFVVCCLKKNDFSVGCTVGFSPRRGRRDGADLWLRRRTVVRTS